MFNKKLKKEINYKISYLNKKIHNLESDKIYHWKYIQALLDAEKQNRKELNTVIAKINQMKTKGKK